MEALGHLLGVAGLGRDRVQIRWISSAEGQLFAEYVTELTAMIRALGPCFAC